MKGRAIGVNRAANRLGLDYVAEAGRMGPPVVPIIDIHTHINGARAAEIWARAADLYGIERVFSMTQLSQAEAVKRVLGERVEFIATPEYMAADRSYAMREGFIENIKAFHERFGARIVKFWAAPRFRDFLDPVKDADLFGLDSDWRVRQAELASELGMMFMTHVADPDTWFQTAYADASKYGTKREQYPPLERMLERFTQPWIAAHMGGWPEDLDFLGGLLERHANLYLDTSATKWMVRELSRHPRERVVAFLERWQGRVLFGSDIVTSDEHLKANVVGNEQFAAHQAEGEAEAMELYASRYWALRTLWESDYEGESPIADPDLAKVEPGKFDEMSAPVLRGKGVARGVLEGLYRGGAVGLVG